MARGTLALALALWAVCGLLVTAYLVRGPRLASFDSPGHCDGLPPLWEESWVRLDVAPGTTPWFDARSGMTFVTPACGDGAAAYAVKLRGEVTEFPRYVQSGQAADGLAPMPADAPPGFGDRATVTTFDPTPVRWPVVGLCLSLGGLVAGASLAVPPVHGPRAWTSRAWVAGGSLLAFGLMAAAAWV